LVIPSGDTFPDDCGFPAPPPKSNGSRIMKKMILFERTNLLRKQRFECIAIGFSDYSYD
jgi:hypothetical protein